MKNNILVVVILVAVIAGGLWYKNTMSAKSAEPIMGCEVSSAPATSSGVMSDTMNADNVREICIEGTEFSFSLASLTLKKDQKVRLKFINTGKMLHDFVVDELSVKTKQITSGSSDIIEFTPDKIGTFEFYCSVGEHRAKGMKGMLTVE